MLRVLDLFSGIGGFSLGLESTGGFRTVAFCEIDPFCRKVLKKHWPEVPQYDDVRTLTADALARDGITVDVITGGFPCQAFSNAARGRNNAPNLWPDMARVVSEVAPKVVIAENVKRAPLATAAEFCAAMGMRADVFHISADAVGADHGRSRWWLVAHPYKDGELPRAINAEMAKLPEVVDGVWGAEAFRAAVCLHDGLPAGLDSPRPYGNAVIPQIPEMIGNAILQAEGG